MSGAAEALTILLRRGANKTRIEDESRYEAQAREILASDWLAAHVAPAAADREAVERVRALADEWEQIHATIEPVLGEPPQGQVIMHAEQLRAALSVPTEAEGTS